MKFLICSVTLSLLFLIVGGEKGTCTNGVEETVWRQAVDEKLEELKVLLEKHTARTDELSCCCQNDTSTTAPTTPHTTTTSTTTPTASSLPTTTTKTAATDEFLYISDSQIYELPSFHLTTSCPVPPHPIPGLSGAVAGLSDGSLVICGGYDGNTFYSSCHTLSDNGWVKTDSLQDTAGYAAASQTTDGLVVTGGASGYDDYLSTTQTLSGGRWTTGPQLPVKMMSHCQVTVRSSVLVAGGYNGSRSAAVFTLEGGRWSPLQSMKTPRSGHACAVYQEEVYAIGGFNTATVDIFNITSNTWRDGPQLPDMSYDGQAVVTSDALYFIGRDGQVVRLASDGSRWEYVTNIASDWVISVFPAPVVTRHNLKC